MVRSQMATSYGQFGRSNQVAPPPVPSFPAPPPPKPVWTKETLEKMDEARKVIADSSEAIRTSTRATYDAANKAWLEYLMKK